ncbi:MAG: YbaB/EbfC family nucleoid-associated protein [Candidatus Tectomicrobia bacterium]|uniref:Nucleoid-associated protein HYY20_12905 n=1 Tax=Tectimicrobiota bacterium TaxID=2528274 RepID=A0A932CQQ4_UNCTE|nr:YbaB/EbfC family nucleoid-associated protein [Candidatus Tectomicrobia bacterium]
MKPPKGMGNMMKQVQEMQEKLLEMQEKMGEKTVEASAGGGMVTAVANGRQELLSIKLDPSVIDPNDVEMLEDLVVAAVNEALRKAREMTTEEMSKLTHGLRIPGLF